MKALIGTLKIGRFDLEEIIDILTKNGYILLVKKSEEMYEISIYEQREEN